MDEPLVKKAKIDIIPFERKELEVGIFCFMSNNRGFKATIKSNWEDFHVHEIDDKGEVVYLTKLLPPLQIKELSVSSILTSEQRSQLTIVSNAEYSKEKFYINVDDLDKQARTMLHKSIKIEFPDLCSNTCEENGSKIISVTKNKPGKNCNGSREDKLPGKYCHFVLYKEGKTTAEAISHISREVHVAPHFFTFSGTKDKRAITTQMVCCSRITAEQLKKASDSLKSIKLGNYCYKDKPLSLGDNLGNKFSIVLRSIDIKEKELIINNIQSVKQHGFLNYFGLQRFGSTSLATHTIGKALLKSNWVTAIDMLLEPLPDDRNDIKAWKEDLKVSQDYDAALKIAHSNDRLLLQGIKRYGKSLQALLILPRNSVQLYVHAYQSYIWNKVLSKRIELYGLKPQVGDLVIIDSTKKGKDAVHILTEEDLNLYSISDIVLPLPGFDIQYPDNAIKQLYNELLNEDDLDESCFKHKVKEFALPGSYRQIVIKPYDVSFDWVQYSDPHASLIVSDYSKIIDSTLNSAIDNEKVQNAIIIHLQLPKSTYATMAIREITHGEVLIVHKMT